MTRLKSALARTVRVCCYCCCQGGCTFGTEASGTGEASGTSCAAAQWHIHLLMGGRHRRRSLRPRVGGC